MARTYQVNPQQQKGSRGGFSGALAAIVTTLFLVLASLSFAAFVPVRWVERQILTADNWVSFASSLPKNSDVSWAVADEITKQIYENVPIEERISEALPPRAGFLADTLSNQLQQRTVNIVQNIIDNDTFSSAWTGANRLAIERFLENARSDKEPRLATAQEKFNVDLMNIKPQLQERLGAQAAISPTLQERSTKALAVTVDLQVKREHLWQLVRTTDTMFAVLPALFVTALLGMLVFTRNRQRSVVVLASIVIVLMFIELIAIKYARQQLLDQVQNDQYISSVSYIYDSLISGLRNALLYGLVIWWSVLTWQYRNAIPQTARLW